MPARCSIALLCTAVLTAQTVTVPPGADVAEQNAQSNPQPVTGLAGAPVAGCSARTQWVYDAANFTSQGITTPILITRMRLRANGVAAAWSGATAGNLVVQLSTAAADHLLMSATFADNHGGDVQTVWNGPLLVGPGNSVTAAAGSAPGGGYFGELDLQAAGVPFAWHPAAGDLCLDFMTTGIAGPATGVVPGWDALTTVPTTALARRSFSNDGQFAATGSPPASHALVIQFDYVPVDGVYAGFSATPRGGPSPLAVTFTDRSWSGLGPITSWAWDFDNDGTVDDTTANPLHVYPCGTWTVKLTVSDGTNSATATQSDLVVTDHVAPGFTAAATASGVVAFTDATVPAATTWAWDFDGDNVIDSTLPNPTFDFGGTGVHDVRLTVSRACGAPAQVTQRVVAAPDLTTNFAGGQLATSNSMAMFDLAVANPLGLEIQALDTIAAAPGVAVTYDVYLTPGSCVGLEGFDVPWRLVARGTGLGAAGRTFVLLDRGIYLPPGSYGLAIHNVAGGFTHGAAGPQSFGNADVTLQNPRVTAGRFAGPLFTPRIWNGAIYYALSSAGNEASYGIFALGCPGALGVPGNVAVIEPRLGATATVAIGGLPLDLAIMVIGFSRTASAHGPLPLDLGVVGAPGCAFFVSDDSVDLRVGTGSSLVWTLFVPNFTAYLGMQFYVQALALDPTANVLGATVSDAAAAVVGR